MKKGRKILTMLVGIILLTVGLTITVSASSYYTDVSSSDSCYHAVTYLRDHNIMVGQTDTYFGKNNTLIRADVVTVLWRMLNQPEPSGTTVTFSDCNSSAYYYKAVRWACSSNVGIASGYENGNFGPADLVSNQDLLTFLYRFACYCGYIDNSSSAQSYYRAAFEQLVLSYPNTFWDYSKVPVGWACQTGFITDYAIVGTASATRGDTAKYIYHFYKTYQKKYGLVVVNTYELESVGTYGNAMKQLLEKCHAETVFKSDITRNEFSEELDNVFSSAKPLDICYLYLHSHGNSTGMVLYRKESNPEENDVVKLIPTALRNYINRYKGNFVVFLHSCYSGIFVSNSVSGEYLLPYTVENYGSDYFDMNAFVNELVGIDNSFSGDVDVMTMEYADLRDVPNIKVLAACKATELSERYLTVKYWCEGAGHNWSTGGNTQLYADYNTDNRISLNELYNYSKNKVLNVNPTQHVVCYPEFDHSIILERTY